MLSYQDYEIKRFNNFWHWCRLAGESRTPCIKSKSKAKQNNVEHFCSFLKVNSVCWRDAGWIPLRKLTANRIVLFFGVQFISSILSVSGSLSTMKFLVIYWSGSANRWTTSSFRISNPALAWPVLTMASALYAGYRSVWVIFAALFSVSVLDVLRRPKGCYVLVRFTRFLSP